MADIQKNPTITLPTSDKARGRLAAKGWTMDEEINNVYELTELWAKRLSEKQYYTVALYADGSSYAECPVYLAVEFDAALSPVSLEATPQELASVIKQRDNVVEAYKDLEYRCQQYREALAAHNTVKQGDHGPGYHVWMPGEPNHLETLVDTCPVVIQAGWLRDLLAEMQQGHTPPTGMHLALCLNGRWFSIGSPTAPEPEEIPEVVAMWARSATRLSMCNAGMPTAEPPVEMLAKIYPHIRALMADNSPQGKILPTDAERKDIEQGSYELDDEGFHAEAELVRRFLERIQGAALSHGERSPTSGEWTALGRSLGYIFSQLRHIRSRKPDDPAWSAVFNEFTFVVASLLKDHGVSLYGGMPKGQDGEHSPGAGMSKEGEPNG